MSRRAIIVHGKPSQEKYETSPTDPSDSHWIPWAKHQFNLAGIQTFAPDMPKPYAPDYETWEEELARYNPEKPNTSFVGLSAGASFLLRYLSEAQNIFPDRLVLVAPWLDLKGKYGEFSKFEIDPELTERCLGSLTVFYSSLDDEQAQAGLAVVRTSLPDARYLDMP
ncbi:MAG: hypothetical protein ACREGC_00825, partial [Minisyncoccia bacterium]